MDSRAAPNTGGRYRPLTNILNIILKEFEDKEYGSLPRPNTHGDKEELVFIPNDPPIIVSEHLEDLVEGKEFYVIPKCRPDVVGVFLSHLCEKYKE